MVGPAFAGGPNRATIYRARAPSESVSDVPAFPRLIFLQLRPRFPRQDIVDALDQPGMLCAGRR